MLIKSLVKRNLMSILLINIIYHPIITRINGSINDGAPWYFQGVGFHNNGEPYNILFMCYTSCTVLIWSTTVVYQPVLKLCLFGWSFQVPREGASPQ